MHPGPRRVLHRCPAALPGPCLVAAACCAACRCVVVGFGLLLAVQTTGGMRRWAESAAVSPRGRHATATLAPLARDADATRRRLLRAVPRLTRDGRGGMLPQEKCREDNHAAVVEEDRKAKLPTNYEVRRLCRARQCARPCRLARHMAWHMTLAAHLPEARRSCFTPAVC